MTKSKITDVFFDLDHTLWDFETNSALTFQKIFQLYALPINLPEFLGVYKAINTTYWKRYRLGEVDKEKLRFGRLNDTFDVLNIDVSKQMILKLSEAYIQHITSFNHLFEDTVTVLDYLQPKYNLHVITNGFNEVQHLKLSSSNIAQYFKTVTNSEMAGVKKPHRDIFNYALNLANTTVKQSVMIGDNFEADIEGAMAVGFGVIYFSESTGDNHLKVPQIQKLIELKNHL